MTTIKSVNGETIIIDDDGKIIKQKPSFWSRFKSKCKATVDWCKEHSKETIAILVVGSGAISQTTKFINKQYTLNEMKRLKERSIYDRSNGHYYYMRRTPTTNEWLEIERRKKNKEPIGLILKDMNLV